jgi:hypothetical protein
MLWRSGGTVWILLSVLALVAGCGGDGLTRGTVSGKVTFDGQPLANGTIVFAPTGGTKGPMAMTESANGQYAITNNAPVGGKHTVKIEGFRDTAKKDELGRVIGEQFIPAKYNEKTTLSAEIAKGSNSHDFALTK